MARVLIALFAIFSLLTIAFGQSSPAVKPTPFFVHCGTLIDGKSDQPRKNVFFEIDGDKIAARCKVTGTHDGHGIGVAPTSAPVEFTGMTIVKVKDGKIVEAWNEFDFMKMYTQVGALTLNLQ